MNSSEIRLRNELRMKGIHPDMVAKVRQVLTHMESLGSPMMITDGLRSAAQQKALYDLGRSKPGKIVTYKDGYKNKSNHQAHDDGWGHAVDLCFLVDLDHDGDATDPTWDAKRPWSTLGQYAESLGLTWGGRWKTLVDLPHLEMA